MPDGNRRDHFLKWIEELSDRQTPSWLGLPNNAEKVIFINSDRKCKLSSISLMSESFGLKHNLFLFMKLQIDTLNNLKIFK